MSDAFRALDPRRLREWNWPAATVLYVSYEWSVQQNSAEALAGRRLVNALLDAGARVHVLAERGGTGEIVHRHLTVTTCRARVVPSSKLLRAAQMIRTSVPEGQGTWVGDVVPMALRILARLPKDTVIYSRAMPGVSNVAAWHVARQTGRPWVAHFSDEWPAKSVLAHGRRWQAPYKPPLFRLWRRRIVRDAGALTFTNPDQVQDVIGRARRHLDKSFVVTHLPSEPERVWRPPQYDRFHLVHTGNFYPGQHTAAPMMRGLRLFLDRTPEAHEHVCFTQAGWAHGDLPDWAGRCGLGSVVRIVGRLSQDDVMALIESASLLLAVDYSRPRSRTLLSKIPDYVGAGRPILAITAPGSTLGRVLIDDGAGLTAHYDSPAEVADRIGIVFESWRQRRLECLTPRPPALDAFRPSRVLAELAGAFVVARDAAASTALCEVLRPAADCP
jgi:hypothetical protein